MAKKQIISEGTIKMSHNEQQDKIDDFYHETIAELFDAIDFFDISNDELVYDSQTNYDDMSSTDYQKEQLIYLTQMANILCIDRYYFNSMLKHLKNKTNFLTEDFINTLLKTSYIELSLKYKFIEFGFLKSLLSLMVEHINEDTDNDDDLYYPYKDRTIIDKHVLAADLILKLSNKVLCLNKKDIAIICDELNIEMPKSVLKTVALSTHITSSQLNTYVSKNGYSDKAYEKALRMAA